MVTWNSSRIKTVASRSSIQSTLWNDLPTGNQKAVPITSRPLDQYNEGKPNSSCTGECKSCCNRSSRLDSRVDVTKQKSNQTSTSDGCGSGHLQPRWGDGVLARKDSQTRKCIVHQPYTAATELMAPVACAHPEKISSILTVAYLYRDHPSHLQKQITVLMSLSQFIRERITILLIDDASYPKLAATHFIPSTAWVHLNITLYRIEPRRKWNIGGARNLAVHLVKGNILLLDIDIAIHESLLIQLLAMSVRDPNGTSGAIIKFNRQQPDRSLKLHPGCMFLSSSSYWQVGGCDEDFVGNYGGTDVHFFWRVSQHPRIHRLDRKDLILQQIVLDPCDHVDEAKCNPRWIEHDPRDNLQNRKLLEW
eukprot:CAMPEP_0184305226 /NCGR_PEP_ID=MMETSP1049-20130417/14548_1 /TAXON_ID=77928 /ORGANISM="Proteomonas sulcata, Strain CCMP704" /LENGTH=363 /DNA_ID=CAMNT_0026617235 /DNA_START=341 /DNA_END=1429 /DNA_ORIENTATION=-